MPMSPSLMLMLALAVTLALWMAPSTSAAASTASTTTTGRNATAGAIAYAHSRRLSSSSSSSSSSSAKVTFVPYPHRKIFHKFIDNGDWVAGDMTTIKTKIDNKNFENFDVVQKQAIQDGLFLPRNGIKYHLFSAEEAITCLKGRTILFAGDNYMIHFFIGLVEILTKDPSNIQIKDASVRPVILANTVDYMAYRFGDLFNVSFIYPDCRHEMVSCFTKEIERDPLIKKADALVMNTMIHQLAMTHDEDKMTRLSHYRTDINKLFSTRTKIVWVTAPSYTTETDAEAAAADKSQRISTDVANFDAIELAQDFRLPIIDVYTLTRKCHWTNCSADGGHRAKFVNRMKAQMLLNNLCLVN